MKLTASLTALALAALVTTACDRPQENTAYNNSGSSASTPSSATTPSGSAPTTSDSAATSAPGTSNMAPGPAGDATGAVSETVTTGKVKAAIAADSGMKDTDVSVTTNAGVVTLSGTVK